MKTYYINAKDRENPSYPCIDGDNYWIEAETEAEAKDNLARREGLYHHELIIYQVKESR